MQFEGRQRRRGNSYTFFQAIFVALQDVHAANRSWNFAPFKGPGPSDILDNGWLKHLLQGDGHSLGDGSDFLITDTGCHYSGCWTGGGCQLSFLVLGFSGWATKDGGTFEDVEILIDR